MTTFLDRALVEHEARQAAHLANPHRAAAMQAIADRVAVLRATGVAKGRHLNPVRRWFR